MDTVPEHSPLPQVAKIPGLDNIIVPQDTLYQTWQLPNTPPNQKPPLYSALLHGTRSNKHTNDSTLIAHKPQKANRPWWARLLVDSILVPFVQGFMLNLGIHWVHYWRRGGGLMGVFRNRFGRQYSRTTK
ncbi:hypothetical protein LPJ77_000627 [Coemansia sp. RSA 2523]|nr:hypothetical protein LPJ54_000272 [Coemansia sp. RSA 1824]KAJ1810797.1 hypothetical protein LPJ77_000627 [Coemansia sp. RSA 2523]KAJ2145226.1 hypothetical protein IW142_002713 [Coemansia sp. RSA 564]KAJ2173138.1 hypothetical protein GGF45_004468 [Coemansia sp. RSA 551]KAJ2405662.1 hypothetical protein J3F80_004036 [Coemansia sp. RSA 2526]KAJ2578441.1 hypothetical protein GGH19_000443 [Coemansia sp. RSA 1807]